MTSGGALLVALAAILATIIGPLLTALVTAIVTGHQRQRERAADWERQDALAEAQNEALAHITHLAKDTHALVNSNLTAVKERNLGAVTRELALMRQLAILNTNTGNPPTPQTLDAIAATEARVQQLQAELADRAKAQAVVDDTQTPR